MLGISTSFGPVLPECFFLSKLWLSGTASSSTRAHERQKSGISEDRAVAVVVAGSSNSNSNNRNNR